MYWQEEILLNRKRFLKVLCLMVFRGFKAEFPLEGILFCTQFPSLGIFINKKVGNRKTKTTQYTAFKTDIIKVVLVFSISIFFTNKN